MTCRDLLHDWNRPTRAAARTARNRATDIRRFGVWQWGERDIATIVAWLLDISAKDSADLIAAFDAAEANTSSHPARKRRLHNLRGALRFIAERDGNDAPHIRPAVRTAA